LDEQSLTIHASNELGDDDEHEHDDERTQQKYEHDGQTIEYDVRNANANEISNDG